MYIVFLVSFSPLSDLTDSAHCAVSVWVGSFIKSKISIYELRVNDSSRAENRKIIQHQGVARFFLRWFGYVIHCIPYSIHVIQCIKYCIKLDNGGGGSDGID